MIFIEKPNKNYAQEINKKSQPAASVEHKKKNLKKIKKNWLLFSFEAASRLCLQRLPIRKYMFCLNIYLEKGSSNLREKVLPEGLWGAG